MLLQEEYLITGVGIPTRVPGVLSFKICILCCFIAHKKCNFVLQPTNALLWAGVQLRFKLRAQYPGTAEWRPYKENSVDFPPADSRFYAEFCPKAKSARLTKALSGLAFFLGR
eukprot:1359486-Rhodomonas_salina.1